MAPHKSNLAEKPPSLVYKIVTSPVHDTARIEWMGVSEYGADALAADATTPHERTQLDEAKDFLRAGLEGGPVRAKQVYKDARDAGIAERTLQRAKDVLRVRSEKVGTEGWSWQLHDKSEGSQEGNRTAGGGDVGDLPLNKGNEAQNTSGKGEGRLGHQGRQGGEHVLDRRLT